MEVWGEWREEQIRGGPRKGLGKLVKPEMREEETMKKKVHENRDPLCWGKRHGRNIISPWDKNAASQHAHMAHTGCRSGSVRELKDSLSGRALCPEM